MEKDNQNTPLPQRKNTRLREFDYSQNGAYFVTVCTHNRRKNFSEIVGAIHESPLQQRSLLSKIMGFLKLNISRDIHSMNPEEGIWQRSYCEPVFVV